MNARKITSLTLLISFLLLMLTSVILYIVPHGRVAYWSDWHLWGLSKTEWTHQHLNLGVLFLIAFGFHLFYNLKPITAYLKNRTKQLRVFTGSFNFALAVTLIVCIGTYFMLPPLSFVIKLGDAITERADIKYGEPPYGHAELSSLKIFSTRVNLDLPKVKQLLNNAGILIENDKQAIGEIARKNNLTSKELYDIMKPAAIDRENLIRFPDQPPPGFGRRTLVDVCAEYDLHLPHILSALKNRGIPAEPENTIKEIAEQNNLEAMTIFEIVHEAVHEK